MKYNKDDIHFDKISPTAFENLCYDLVVKYGFTDLVWRKGGADDGRDIEANYIFNNSIKPKKTKYFFECKHYTSSGVPPEHLNSKIAWADAGNPDTLVIFTSSYLTNSSRAWLEKLAPQKHYEIICIEGEDLKERLINYPEIIERYFSQNRYEQMLKDIKDYKIKFNVSPSYEFFKELVENIDLTKLDIEDFGFILLNFYTQYQFFETRDDYYGDFDKKVMYRLLDFLKNTITNERLDSFEEYKDNYDELGGSGIFDEMFWIDYEGNFDEMKKLDFQVYVLHLNHKLGQDKWKIGDYLFVIYQDVAFEIFKDEKTEIRIISNFNPDRISELSLDLSDQVTIKYKIYLEYFNTKQPLSGEAKIMYLKHLKMKRVLPVLPFLPAYEDAGANLRTLLENKQDEIMRRQDKKRRKYQKK